MIIAIAALIICLNIAQDHDQGYYGVGHDYDQGNELALIKKIVLDCYVRAVLSFLQCFKMIYPNLLGFGKIFGWVVLVVPFLLSYIRKRQQCFCVKAPNAYSTPSACWLLHNGDSISFSFPHFSEGNFPPQTNICSFLSLQRYECDWNDVEDTFENAQWRKV